jgi:hypothetical protein
MDKLPRIDTVAVKGDRTLELRLRDGQKRSVSLAGFIARYENLAPLDDPAVFAKARVVAWGAAVGWTDDMEISAGLLLRAAEEQQPFRSADFTAWMQRLHVSNKEAADVLGLSLSSVKNMKSGDAEISTAVGAMCRALEADPSLFAAHFRPRVTGRPRKLASPSLMVGVGGRPSRSSRSGQRAIGKSKALRAARTAAAPKRAGKK